MQAADVPAAIALTATEGWGYTPRDFARLLALEPDGLLVLEYAGRILAVASVTTYADVAWIGAVVVQPEWRGKGAGRQLLEAVLAFCDRRCRAARLNAYSHVVPFYERFGFRRETENARFTASGVTGFSGGRASPPADLGVLAAFDARFFGADRGRLLRTLAAEPGAFLLTATRGPETLGYAAGSVEDGACEIGPMVVAPGEAVAAETLLEEALGQPRVRDAAITVPLANAAAVDALEALGFREAFRTVRMTRGAPVAEELAGIWGLGGLEKG
jgi:GNAT superfamily N-acetyltransferase